MKQAAVFVLLLLALPAQAQMQTQTQAQAHFGYAFDQPKMLAQQLLWGIVHGARLLGAACQRRGDDVAALAYADWLDKQWPPIRLAERDLSRYYFNRDAVPLEAIDHALNLQPELAQADDEMGAACATLPAALAAPRYDLEQFYQYKAAQ